MYRLLIFPTPLDAYCELQHDTGVVVSGVPAVHPSGRRGQAFDLPETILDDDGENVPFPNGHGARLRINAPNHVLLDQRGIVYVNDGQLPYPWLDGQTAAFAADDFMLEDAPTTLPSLVVSGQFLARQVP